jgi:Fe-S cluster biosynthesis and repair protein YggX
MNTMSRTVVCAKLGQELPGLAWAPWPGPVGKRIYAEISQQAWSQWLAHQTMLINEHRLNPLDPKARAFLEAEMVRFLFEGGAQRPAGYVPPTD